MSGQLRRKWRPPLWFVLAGPLAAVFVLPLVGVGYFRLAGGILGWRETVVIIGGMGLVTAAILGVLLWRLVLRPVAAMTQHAGAVANGAEAAPLVHFGTPEFTALGHSVMDMGRVLQGRERVVRSYADHVTHELKSPLSAIKGAAEILEDQDIGPQDRARMLANIDAAVTRIENLLEDQRAFARATDPLAAGVVQLSDVIAGQPGVVVAKDGQLPLGAQVVTIVLDHLIGNAMAVGATQITLRCENEALLISDDGPGISEGNRDRIFDPFFTTRRDAGGTGMGLAIVRRMLEAQGAAITLDNSKPTTFRITF